MRCIRTPEIAAYEEALARHAPEAEITELKRAVRAGRHPGDDSDRRQSAMGQVAGMVRDVKPVAALIEGMLTEAAALAARLPGVAASTATRAEGIA